MDTLIWGWADNRIKPPSRRRKPEICTFYTFIVASGNINVNFRGYTPAYP